MGVGLSGFRHRRGRAKGPPIKRRRMFACKVSTEGQEGRVILVVRGNYGNYHTDGSIIRRGVGLFGGNAAVPRQSASFKGADKMWPTPLTQTRP